MSMKKAYYNEKVNVCCIESDDKIRVST